MCVAVNGLEYVRRWLLNLGEELRVEQILTALENQAGESVRIQWRNTMITPLEQTPGQMLLFINQIVSRIGAKVLCDKNIDVNKKNQDCACLSFKLNFSSNATCFTIYNPVLYILYIISLLSQSLDKYLSALSKRSTSQRSVIYIPILKRRWRLLVCKHNYCRDNIAVTVGYAMLINVY